MQHSVFISGAAQGIGAEIEQDLLNLGGICQYIPIGADLCIDGDDGGDDW